MSKADEAAEGDLSRKSLSEIVGMMRPAHLWSVVTALVVVVSGAFYLGTQFEQLKRPPNDPPELDHQVLVALKEQADTDPPYYGNSVSGNVRPQMETYIKGFVFPSGCPGSEVAKNLLKMIEDRANKESPTEYFAADNGFRAEMDRFRAKVRTYALTGKWPDAN